MTKVHIQAPRCRILRRFRSQLACAVALVLTSYSIAMAQIPPSSPLDQRVSVTANEARLSDILRALARSADVGIGFEGTLGKQQSRERISFQRKDASLRMLLDELVKLVPEYAWRLENHTITVFPKETSSRIPDIEFSERLVEGDSSRNAILGLIIDPDVTERYRKAGLALAESRIPSPGLNTTFVVAYSHKRQVQEHGKPSVSLRVRSLREALDQALRSKGITFWSLSQSYSENQKLLLEIEADDL